MFEMTIVQFSNHVRSGTGQWIAEAVATAGLLLVILRAPAGRAAAMVASYIGAAYWFTASTSFANPAVAIARSLTNTFAGIRPIDLPGFILAELCGAMAGMLLMNWLLGRPKLSGPVAIAETRP
jgi:glycerol uptake facilitator-like aquaporin